MKNWTNLYDNIYVDDLILIALNIELHYYWNKTNISELQNNEKKHFLNSLIDAGITRRSASIKNGIIYVTPSSVGKSYLESIGVDTSCDAKKKFKSRNAFTAPFYDLQEESLHNKKTAREPNQNQKGKFRTVWDTIVIEKAQTKKAKKLKSKNDIIK